MKGVVFMKNCKKPTRAQAELIKGKRLNFENWLVTKDTPAEMHIANRATGTERVIYK